ncbi:MAG: hypothetical protein M1825_005386 [Sarcosagium campestre]|nr:MAG: hypothetical protein M1825_005386 [Sarcosagium campestre]
MDHASCNVIYVDRRARCNRMVRRCQGGDPATENGTHLSHLDPLEVHADVTTNIGVLLSTFHQVYICTSGASCRSKISQLNEDIDAKLIPTVVLIDVPLDDDNLGDALTGPASLLSPAGHDRRVSPEPTDASFYGLRLLQFLAAEIQYQNISKLFVPIVALSNCARQNTPSTAEARKSANQSTLETAQVLKFLEAGATDVAISPLQRESIVGHVAHAYRAHKEVGREQKAFLAIKRGRRRSWVGVDDEKPFAYLREAMVSGLMDGICKPQNDGEKFENMRIIISPQRRHHVTQAVGTWAFSAHDLSDDELLFAASVMLQHALDMPELKHWRIPTDNLNTFLIATRTAYNSFVPYHNFRHVVDVLQAMFYFLLRLGILPLYSVETASRASDSTCPIASLLRPFDALTLLISAIGHDVGHPGVNNAFLVTLSAPLAQLYNDMSVLESFHCAAFSQILRRYWPAAFQSTDMRKLLINSILATDMGVHFDYMRKLGFLQEKLHENKGTDGWDGRYLEEQRTLACSLLIKCADISNVARKYDVASQWAIILTDEFARQASMEKDLDIPSALFAPPIKDSVIEMGKSQIGFMNLFALPLFQGVTDILPAMQFSVDEMSVNKSIWEKKMEVEHEVERLQRGQSRDIVDGAQSPRSGSMSSLEPPLTDGVSPSSDSLGRSAEPQLDSSSGTINQPPLTNGQAGKPRQLPPPHRPTDRHTPKLRTRHSSTGVPGQHLPALGMNGPPDVGGRRPSADHSLVAVLVTSPGRSTKRNNSNINNNNETTQTQTQTQTQAIKRDKRKSSEKSSLPSDWHSQATSPTNITYSPTTRATSFLSDHTSDNEAYVSHSSSSYAAADGAGRGSEGENSSVTTAVRIKEVRSRPSRWRLNFWKSKRKIQSGGGS